MAVDLRQLGARFPLAMLGAVGDDQHGAFVLAECARLGIDTAGVARLPDVATSFTDAMVERVGGRRTFFHHIGANGLFDGAAATLPRRADPARRRAGAASAHGRAHRRRQRLVGPAAPGAVRGPAHQHGAGEPRARAAGRVRAAVPAAPVQHRRQRAGGGRAHRHRRARARPGRPRRLGRAGRDGPRPRRTGRRAGRGALPGGQRRGLPGRPGRPARARCGCRPRRSAAPPARATPSPRACCSACTRAGPSRSACASAPPRPPPACRGQNTSDGIRPAADCLGAADAAGYRPTLGAPLPASGP